MKNECEIVGDLLPNYIEDLLTKNIKEYVKKHINSCSECKRKLELMKEEKIKEENRNEREEKADLEHLKKYKKKFILLKICAIAFAIIVAFMAVSFVIEYFKISNIFNNANTTKQELLQLENYSIYTTSRRINYKTSEEMISYDEFYYKDGKYKKISKTIAINAKFDGATEGLAYGEVDSKEKMSISEDQKEIVKFTTNYIQVPKSRNINYMYTSIDIYIKELNSLAGMYMNAGFALYNNLREERFQGRECYVLRTEDKNSYNEVWIDKETFIPTREIQDIYGESYDETTRTFYKNNVTDEDVTLDQSKYEGYTITNKEYTIEDEKARNLYERI